MLRETLHNIKHALRPEGKVVGYIWAPRGATEDLLREYKVQSTERVRSNRRWWMTADPWATYSSMLGLKTDTYEVRSKSTDEKSFRPVHLLHLSHNRMVTIPIIYIPTNE